MANIPGATNILPGTIVETVTQSRGAAVPGGIRVTAIIGEGSRSETLVSNALGGGRDGFNSTYTSTTSGVDGRHFKTTFFPLVENRTKIYRNGVLLTGVEAIIDSNAFSNLYDYRVDPATGQVELQRAYLVDQGGAFYKPFSINVGLGSITNLELVDTNAPSETWSIRCISVQRDTSNNPIQNTAKFVAFGSVSGNKLDANGNAVVWTANGVVVSNGVVKFSIDETKISLNSVSPFREGDGFTVQVQSGVLIKNDSLTSEYIAVGDMNDPTYLSNMAEISKKHGLASTSNNLTLGCQLAFANSAPGIMCLQAAPSMPRRNSYLLVDSFQATSTDNDDFIFPLPIGVQPDNDANIHFFVKNNATNVETQVLPNKLEYYTLDTAGYPTTSAFIQDNASAPAGYAYFYTVVKEDASVAFGFDGYIARDYAFTNKGFFSSPSVVFDSSYVGKSVKILDALNAANNGTFTISSVSNGKLYINGPTVFPEFTTESAVAFEVINPATGLPVTGGSATDGNLVAYLGTDTADFTSDPGTGVDFSTITSLLTKRIQINGSTTNNGLYDITAYDSLTNTITLKKALVGELNLRYEVIDETAQSFYVVINKNVVPDGFALRVSLVDIKDAGFYDAGWTNALEALERVECDIVVPLPRQTMSVIFQNALSHVLTMSAPANKRERVLMIGALNGLTVDNLVGAKPAAVENIGLLEGIQGDSVVEVLEGNIEDLTNYAVPDSFGNTYRCTYFYPDQIVVQAGADNVLVDGFYISAAAGGYYSANNKIEYPLTGKTLSGFTILRNKLLSPAQQTALANAGVCVVQPVQGGGKVVWGITTSQSGFIEEQEQSIIFIRDRIAKVFRNGFDAFIGVPDTTPGFTASLNARAQAILNSFLSQGIISAWKDLIIARDSVDPRQWNISVGVQPSYPVNFIYIRVGIGTI